ncbi:MAG: potassium transporter TrkG [Acidimicrobiales bacterium]
MRDRAGRGRHERRLESVRQGRDPGAGPARGLGITTLAALLAVLVSRRLGLRSRMLAQTETGATDLGSVGRLVRRIVAFSLAFEAVGAVVLTGLFWAAHGQGVAEAAWNGAFHAVSAFNNAGFSSLPDNLVSFNDDPPLLLVVSLLIVAGGIGFPVLSELLGSAWRRPRTWSLHTRLTVAATGVLLATGAVAVLALEWTNPATLGPMGVGDKVANAWFGSVTPRTAGFNLSTTARSAPRRCCSPWRSCSSVAAACRPPA